ncbi:cob(I)yrinic acid a,c-diamide adenosyltransferase [Candidatus Woesearchaeota archaeon]|nr:cob(I)yrinic acid a,c-diamide adenosyltransferase [Candidatus Woesearchaeota archaeon]
MKCYTRNGDTGETYVFGGSIEKHSERIDAIGSVDELNSFLGASAAFSSDEDVKRIIHEIENDLFSIGAELATVTDRGEIKITARHVERIEALIDKLDEQLPKQTKFIVPSGTKAAMLINVARTVSRRAERALVRLDRSEKINQELLKYANRLSSLLHVLSRFENKRSNVIEKNPVYS